MVIELLMIANGQVNIQDEVIPRAHDVISQFLGMPSYCVGVYRLLTLLQRVVLRLLR